MGVLIKGKPVVEAITKTIIKEVNELKKEKIFPKLTFIRVGQSDSAISYEKGALKQMNKCGILSEVKEFPFNITQEEFINELRIINNDETTHGILVFRPLPKHLDEDVIKHVISPQKDIDCFNPQNVAKVTEGDSTGFPPCTPTAVMEILDHYNVDILGKHAVVVGKSMVVGKPVSTLLLNNEATVTICHEFTQNLSEIASQADILVVAVGKAKLFGAECVKDGAVVIDIGINVNEKGDICGDLDTDACLKKASMITPVPGGVGPVTTSMLAKHVVKAAKLLNVLDNTKLVG